MNAPFSYYSTNISDDIKNGGGRDFDIVLRRSVDRHEVVDAASDVSKASPYLTASSLDGDHAYFIAARQGWLCNRH